MAKSKKLQLGIRQIQEQKYDQAMMTFQVLMNKASTDEAVGKEKNKIDIVECRFYYGKCLQQLKMDEEAEAYLRETLALFSNRSALETSITSKLRIFVVEELAKILYARGRDDKAYSEYALQEATSPLEKARQTVSQCTPQGFGDKEQHKLVTLLSNNYTALGELHIDANNIQESKLPYKNSARCQKELLELETRMAYSDSHLRTTKFNIASDLHHAWEFEEAATMYRNIEEAFEEKQKRWTRRPRAQYR
ncbi:hypothetical protein N0V90_000380 [Kalmusia sp. IMI 367209]|nr:hypothetical protein N0V90_000380 [Kalmusia sp. IMI 367209]